MLLLMLRPLCMARSNLEYCSTMHVVSQYSFGYKRVSTVQRAATRYILSHPEIKYEERCTMLHLHPLFYRREITDLLYVFK